MFCKGLSPSPFPVRNRSATRPPTGALRHELADRCRFPVQVIAAACLTSVSSPQGLGTATRAVQFAHDGSKTVLQLPACPGGIEAVSDEGHQRSAVQQVGQHLLRPDRACPEAQRPAAAAPAVHSISCRAARRAGRGVV